MIPFVIILLIPLSPFGHVLVFGAIQRFFPDFFPSCFTEQRQNLLQLYENAEYTEFTINENFKVRVTGWGPCIHPSRKRCLTFSSLLRLFATGKDITSRTGFLLLYRQQLESSLRPDAGRAE